jgi:bifunctional non-homologous end joining protein LigD
MAPRAKGERAKKADYPGFVQPALATLQAEPPAGARWVHEIKFDGYRAQAHIRAGGVTLYTRTGLDWTARFGLTLAGALRRLAVREAILDGEVVVEAAGGLPSFAALQDALATGSTGKLSFYAFDLLHLDGRDLRALPLIERKATLAAIIPAPGVLRYSDHFEDGAALLRRACALQLEGIVSKRLDCPYRSGRGKDWLKTKCSLRQEFVIAGFLPLKGYARAVGALVLGYYDAGALIYAGRVGTGFSNKAAVELYHQLEAILAASPFTKRLPRSDARGVCFVRPELVAEVEFRGWTNDRLVRHASFRGLREDKRAEEVVIERE